MNSHQLIASSALASVLALGLVGNAAAADPATELSTSSSLTTTNH